jgi:hypothetical protein
MLCMTPFRQAQPDLLKKIGTQENPTLRARPKTPNPKRSRGNDPSKVSLTRRAKPFRQAQPDLLKKIGI